MNMQFELMTYGFDMNGMQMIGKLMELEGIKEPTQSNIGEFFQVLGRSL
jgi:hypothetical protein